MAKAKLNAATRAARKAHAAGVARLNEFFRFDAAELERQTPQNGRGPQTHRSRSKAWRRKIAHESRRRNR